MRDPVAMRQIEQLDAWAELRGPGYPDTMILLGGKAEQFTPPKGVNSCLRIRSRGETIRWVITLPAAPIFGVHTKRPLQEEDFDRVRKALGLPNKSA